MRKRLALLGLLILSCLLIISCSWASVTNNHRTRNTKGLMEYNETTKNIQYHNIIYRKDEDQHFSSVAETANLDDLFFLAWHSDFPFTYDFYSYESESPDFILEVGIDCNIWFSETYNYMNDIFVIEDTEIEIVFEKTFENDTICISSLAVKEQTLYCHSKLHPMLRTTVNIFSFNDDYYMYIGNKETAYRLSETFKEMLIDNGIIA